MHKWQILVSIFALMVVCDEAKAGDKESEQGKTNGVIQAEAEMTKAFGTLPSWLMAYPENARAAA